MREWSGSSVSRSLDVSDEREGCSKQSVDVRAKELWLDQKCIKNLVLDFDGSEAAYLESDVDCRRALDQMRDGYRAR